MAGLVPLAPQFRRQLTHTLTSPAERRLRVAPAGRLHQPVQVLAQARVTLHGALAAPTWAADAPPAGTGFRLPQLPHPASNHGSGHSRRPCHYDLPTTPDGQGFRRNQQPPRPLIYHGRHRLVTLPDTRFIDYHPSSIA